MLDRNAPACVSVCEADQSPYWMYRMSYENRLLNIIEPLDEVARRQDLPPVYIPNGAIYIARIDWLSKVENFISTGTVGYKMEKNRSIDIDDANDFEEFLRILSLANFK